MFLTWYYHAVIILTIIHTIETLTNSFKRDINHSAANFNDSTLTMPIVTSKSQPNLLSSITNDEILLRLSTSHPRQKTNVDL